MACAEARAVCAERALLAAPYLPSVGLTPMRAISAAWVRCALVYACDTSAAAWPASSSCLASVLNVLASWII
ncbi:hypothetical protein D3C81_2211330 [compost metagenome]